METFLITVTILALIIMSVSLYKFSTLREELERIDKHMHYLVEKAEDSQRQDMRFVLSLLGVRSISINKREDLVIATSFDGSKQITKLNTATPFVPVKVKKIKKGVEMTEYNGELLEFTPAVEEKYSSIGVNFNMSESIARLARVWGDEADRVTKGH